LKEILGPSVIHVETVSEMETEVVTEVVMKIVMKRKEILRSIC